MIRSFCLVCLLLFSHAVLADDHTIYLVRHAEKVIDNDQKMLGSSDPALSELGQHRADKLAAWLRDRQLEAVWSSDYQRTRDTAAPAAREYGLEITIYDPHRQTTLASLLLMDSRNALVVGHSNTIPELAQMLCECEVEPITENEYDRLLVIEVDGSQRRLMRLSQDALF